MGIFLSCSSLFLLISFKLHTKPSDQLYQLTSHEPNCLTSLPSNMDRSEARLHNGEEDELESEPYDDRDDDDYRVSKVAASKKRKHESDAEPKPKKTLKAKGHVRVRR
jgi:hypothetical protein